jgi:hypothetical protein
MRVLLAEDDTVLADGLLLSTRPMPSAHDDPPGAEPPRGESGHAPTFWDRLRPRGSLKDLVETRERVHAP